LISRTWRPVIAKSTFMKFLLLRHAERYEFSFVQLLDRATRYGG
jgi:hypothetical protein